ncbi:Methyltransferase domain protein [Roseivivax jejudonensis]|uniref:Methyltransferase domain protein n=1 Tax=Roseivivax jejudonensis TaxID=1529041 RepID=A0A1X6YNK7_9RHOB|nr:FkbM family methyltransferase [Roseivivax jejudonensis]SLN26848.1 Methyltransferase domain protein [Roseivivax jejudonensis]
MSSALSDAPTAPRDIAARFHGVAVPASPFLTERRITRLNSGRYEREEVSGALAVVRPEDRVLELGAGIGAVGAAIALNTGAEAVLAFEANPDLVPAARALYAANGLEDRVTVRHAALGAGPDRPESATFRAGKSSLSGHVASGLVPRDADRRGDVPVEEFEAVAAAFRPTVLLMDIVGGEIDLLPHIDLSRFRAVVVEFHPGAYGQEGVKACKSALKRAGLAKRSDLSTRLVWTCERTTPDAGRPEDSPRPEGGWSDSLQVLDGAVVVPPDTISEMRFHAGVLTAEGAPCPEAATWRGVRRITAPPKPPATPPESLPGTWLWGGLLYAHFGHFLVESVTRLWALDHLPEPVEGIVFYAKFDAETEGPRDFHGAFLHQLVTDLPIRIVSRPTEVARLVVPGQAFGLGSAIRGTERFRAAFARFGADTAPEGPEKLYVSRAGLGPNRGGLLFESRLEERLAAEGYEIFRPERHDLQTQIARYKAARRIVAAEGSALHLYAFCGDPGQKVAIVVRRMSKSTHHIRTHIEAFAGAEVTLADAIGRAWVPEGRAPTHMTMAEIDFPRLGATLEEAGFVSGGDTWAPVTEDEARAFIMAKRLWRRRGYHPKRSRSPAAPIAD